jgi:microcystin-dependent protein
MPNEPIKGLNTPNTGDLPGAWGTAAVNPNFSAIGGMLGGVITISVSAATTVALTAGTGSITPGAGPFQQYNNMLRFTGSPIGTAIYQFSVPGTYVIDNQLVGTTYPLIIAPASGTGTQVGIPPGRKTRIAFDGTSVDFENAEFPGQALDLHGVTALPVWMRACTVTPYLIKDGSTYSSSVYPQLAAQLGSTFGGNGVTTFGVPDERNRMRLPVDTNGPGSFSNRVTSVSGINGSTMGAAGGDQLMQSHNHIATSTVTDPGHSHGAPVGNSNGFGLFASFVGNIGTVQTNSTTTGVTVATNIGTTGSGGSQNMPPTIVSFLPLIKT